MTPQLSRGDVIRVRLDPTEGREIRKTRPAVVVSNNAACRYDSVVQVVPITVMPQRTLRPYEAEIGTESSGLSKKSRVVANQIRTIAKHRITTRLGSVTTTEIEAIDRAVSVQLGLPIRP